MAERSLLVLPGTHSKWAHVVDGRVQRFTTFMTGELFDVLRTHSILGRPAREARRSPNDADAAAAFARGVLAARDADGGLARSLFSVRALVLAGQVDAACSLDYLSGLLIGDEVRNGLAEGDRPRALIGDPALCARYVAALELFGVEVAPIVADAAPDGLWTIAQHALLIASTDEQAIA
jgi:2-dehydro-3-deoxygalactonokinase